jgi:prophage regulatory protein
MATKPEPYGALPATGYVRQSKVLIVVPYSPSTLWRKVKEGTFPEPIKLAPRITAWRVEDIREFLDRAVLADSSYPSPTRSGDLTEGAASRPTTNCDSNVPSLTPDSCTENGARQPQTDSANLASSRLPSRKVRAR